MDITPLALTLAAARQAAALLVVIAPPPIDYCHSLSISYTKHFLSFFELKFIGVLSTFYIH